MSDPYHERCVMRLLGRLLLAACLAAAPCAVLAQAPGPLPADGSRTLLRDGLVVVILVFVSSLFVTAETAFLSVRRSRIEQLVEEGDRRARVVAALLAEPTRMLATLQVALTIVQLFSAGEAANRFAAPFADWLRTAPAGAPLAPVADLVALVVVIGGVALLTLVVGEITPKSLAIQYAEPIALWAAYPVVWMQKLLAPAVSFVTWLCRLLVRPFGGSVSFHTSAMTEEELKIMVEHSEEFGVIEPQEKEMIHSIFEFGDTTVRRVMTPRLDITAVEADAPIADVVQVITDSGHSRLPVYDDDLDNIVGIVHAKDVLSALGPAGQGASTPLRNLLRPPYYIPESKRVGDLLAEFRRGKMQFAVVRDEYGTVTGVVTIEDLLEEIVGDIQDEYDVEEPVLHQVDEHTCIVDARMSVTDFNERMGTELPAEDADTIGGLLFGILGHQPQPGEGADIDTIRFEVAETDGRRVQKVRVVRRPHGREEGEDAAEAE